MKPYLLLLELKKSTKLCVTVQCTANDTNTLLVFFPLLFISKLFTKV